MAISKSIVPGATKEQLDEVFLSYVADIIHKLEDKRPEGRTLDEEHDLVSFERVEKRFIEVYRG